MDEIIQIKKYDINVFENIKHIGDLGNEYWNARELQLALKYTQWRNFELVIKKAKISCENSNYKGSDHFADASKMVKAGVSSKDIKDYALSRFACYLIVQNSDPNKEVVALGQAYFAVQTRKQEISEMDYARKTYHS